MTGYIAFDLEGPLSPQDNAYDLMRLFPDGGRLFEAISRYDDILTLEEREGYEPGDTLALIVPFLVRHGITEADIARLAAAARFTGGAAPLVSWLHNKGWRVFCITTTYEQYAIHITHKLDIYAHNVAGTPFPLDRMRQSLSEGDRRILERAEADILALPADDVRLKAYLDDFFWKKLPGTDIGVAAREVKPVGGRRKVAALARFSEKYGAPLPAWVVIGDSITDFRMLRTVEDAGGLAIAFNANGYALPHATMGLASTSIADLTDVLAAWQKGGRQAAEAIVKQKEKAGGVGDRGYFNWLSGSVDITPVIEVHKRIRRLVREEAGKLG
jgi:energy-converting hydrogenase A subunit R